jgi:serine/threonine protein phosphatase 1
MYGTHLSSVKRSHALTKLPENTAGRDFFVGDIHGDYSNLMSELDAVKFDKDVDRLIAVGDLIDRGPDSLKCLNLTYEPWFHCVIGNHEDFFISAFLEGDSSAFINLLRNGGRWTLDEDSSELRVIAADVLASMPLALEIPFNDRTIGVIHAACTSGNWGFFDHNSDIWNRRISRAMGDGSDPLPSEAQVKGIDIVVVGHNVVDSPTIRGNTVNLDGGASRGRGITLMAATDLLAFYEQHVSTGAAESIYAPPAPTSIDVEDGPSLF